MLFEISTHLLGLIGLLFTVIGSVILFIFKRNIKIMDKIKPLKWMNNPKEDGSLNFRVRSSKLDKYLLIAYSIWFIGVLLQVFSYL